MTAAHGTASRARQHYRDGTPLCEPCRKAAQQQQAEWRRKHRPDLAEKPQMDWEPVLQRVRAMLDGMAP